MRQLTFVFSSPCHNRNDMKFLYENSGGKKDVLRHIWSCAHDKVRTRDLYGHAQVSPMSNCLISRLVAEEQIWSRLQKGMPQVVRGWLKW